MTDVTPHKRGHLSFDRRGTRFDPSPLNFVTNSKAGRWRRVVAVALMVGEERTGSTALICFAPWGESPVFHRCSSKLPNGSRLFEAVANEKNGAGGR